MQNFKYTEFWLRFPLENNVSATRSTDQMIQIDSNYIMAMLEFMVFERYLLKKCCFVTSHFNCSYLMMVPFIFFDLSGVYI